MLGKGQLVVVNALNEVKDALPLRLLGINSDNGSEFINWHPGRWCARRGIQFTCGRPYKKDDNAHIEQKNWTHVHKLLGWNHYDALQAVGALNDLYRNKLRLWLNLFLPSVKLQRKVSVGSRLCRRYGPAQTPFDHVLTSPGVDTLQAAELQALRWSLDPFQLARTIDRKIEHIDALADRRKPSNPSSRLDTF